MITFICFSPTRLPAVLTKLSLFKNEKQEIYLLGDYHKENSEIVLPQYTIIRQALNCFEQQGTKCKVFIEVPHHFKVNNPTNNRSLLLSVSNFLHTTSFNHVSWADSEIRKHISGAMDIMLPGCSIPDKDTDFFYEFQGKKYPFISLTFDHVQQEYFKWHQKITAIKQLYPPKIQALFDEKLIEVVEVFQNLKKFLIRYNVSKDESILDAVMKLQEEYNEVSERLAYYFCRQHLMDLGSCLFNIMLFHQVLSAQSYDKIVVITGSVHTDELAELLYKIGYTYKGSIDTKDTPLLPEDLIALNNSVNKLTYPLLSIVYSRLCLHK
ncbi:hypothetical protein H0X48_00075 [Candidatus Dependentiae bacterium]|nr:hypothetical protein [Candidatus Dependentiae bacterium]